MPVFYQLRSLGQRQRLVLSMVRSPVSFICPYTVPACPLKKRGRSGSAFWRMSRHCLHRHTTQRRLSSGCQRPANSYPHRAPVVSVPPKSSILPSAVSRLTVHAGLHRIAVARHRRDLAAGVRIVPNGPLALAPMAVESTAVRLEHTPCRRKFLQALRRHSARRRQ